MNANSKARQLALMASAQAGYTDKYASCPLHWLLPICSPMWTRQQRCCGRGKKAVLWSSHTSQAK